MIEECGLASAGSKQEQVGHLCKQCNEPCGTNCFS